MLDQAAAGFDAFVRRHRADLWRAAWLLTGDRQKADDLVQTALARTYGRYATLGNDHKFESYVRTTMFRTYASWWRRKWNAEVPTEAGDHQSSDPINGVNIDLIRALAELPRMQRAVLVLRFFEDRPVAEVARLLGIAEGTVKAHTSQGCATLRRSPHLADDEEWS